MAFCVDKDLLGYAETLSVSEAGEEHEEHEDIELEEQGTERKLHFKQELLVEFNNKSVQVSTCTVS